MITIEDALKEIFMLDSSKAIQKATVIFVAEQILAYFNESKAEESFQIV